MPLRGFDVASSPSRATPADPDDLRRAGEILERENLAARVPEHKFLRVLLGDSIAPGSSLAAAHSPWVPEYFDRIGTPAGFPRQPDGVVCPAGLVSVSVDCVVQTIGWASYW